MWYTRRQYAALNKSGIRPDAKIREEWYLWSYFLQENRDVSGRCFAGVVDIPNGVTKIAAGEFNEYMLQQDIQVKEGEALRATLSMIVQKHWFAR